jgi:hypothetical protein
VLRRVALILTFWLAGSFVRGSPADAVLAALDDARKLPPQVAYLTRYFDLSALPEDQREPTRQAFTFWVNSLSREANISRPREVSVTLLAVYLPDYTWNDKFYERLGFAASAEPYFHVIGATTTKDGKAARVVLPGPWLPQAEYKELVKLTQSNVPVLRADWFVYQTGQQEDRFTGYYNFLGVGEKEADFQRLVGADPKLARERRKEMADAVFRSRVTHNNRGIAYQAAFGGSYYYTADFKTSKDRQNTLRLAQGDTEPPRGDATEQYGHLPNGLWAYYLGNQDGARQNVAPDFIASDSTGVSTDRRVHVGVSCVRCHLAGLQEVDGYYRKIYKDKTELGTLDPTRAKLFEQLYLSDLPGQIADDNARYAKLIKKVNGLTPQENVRAFGDLWANYEKDMLLADVAREMGVAPDRLKAALENSGGDVKNSAGEQKKLLDPVVVGLLKGLPARRDHVEELMPLFWAALGNKP